MLEELRAAVCAANRRLPALGLAPLNFGNASGIDRASSVVAIKPSGVDYASLRPEDIVLVDLQGKVVAGGLKPSTDTPTHVSLYRSFPSIGGIVHTHSPAATSFAQAARPIPALGTTHADYFNGPVPVTRELTDEEIARNYEEATGTVLKEALNGADPLSLPAALAVHHGPFIWGGTVDQAVENACALEFVADCALRTLALAPAMREMPVVLRQKHFLRKHGPSAYYGQKRAH
ncbi:MAG TPA: L-ribulose-5-phosphate 4-epimerase AraD [Opitutaceae bacterium]|jgi:L-ribulose-5-phosphate 4-epimerase